MYCGCNSRPCCIGGLSMKNIFKYTEKIFWFDSQGENIFSFQVFDDGSVEFYDFADERIPAEINNKYLLPSKS